MVRLCEKCTSRKMSRNKYLKKKYCFAFSLHFRKHKAYRNTSNINKIKLQRLKFLMNERFIDLLSI